jgi:sulfonate transport system permease protein
VSARPQVLVPVSIRSAPRSQAHSLTLLRRALTPSLLVLIWIGTTVGGLVDPSILPSPAGVARGLVRLWSEQHLALQIGVSVARALVGSAFGISLGLIIGVAAGLTQLGEEIFDALLQMLRTVPFLALVPLFIVWFGIGELPKLLLIALATCFPIYLNTFTGVRNVDRNVIEAARSFGLKGARLVREVVLPLALPSILTGVRFSLGVSVLVLIAAEQINASAGIGYLLNTAQLYQQVDVILICIAIYALLGLLGDLSVRLLEKHLMPWRSAVAAR